MLNVAQESNQQQLANPRIIDTELARVDSNYSQQGGVYFAGVAMLCVCMWYPVCVFACGATLCVCVCCYAACVFAVLRCMSVDRASHAFVCGICGL